MILKVYSVFDKAVQAYMQPFYARSAGEAIRSFTELANDPQTNVARHPTDFTLFALGEFDDNSGGFDVFEPTRLVGAHEVVSDVASPSPTPDPGLMRAQNARNGKLPM